MEVTPVGEGEDDSRHRRLAPTIPSKAGGGGRVRARSSDFVDGGESGVLEFVEQFVLDDNGYSLGDSSGVE